MLVMISVLLLKRIFFSSNCKHWSTKSLYVNHIANIANFSNIYNSNVRIWLKLNILIVLLFNSQSSTSSWNTSRQSGDKKKDVNFDSFFAQRCVKNVCKCLTVLEVMKVTLYIPSTQLCWACTLHNTALVLQGRVVSYTKFIYLLHYH